MGIAVWRAGGFDVVEGGLEVLELATARILVYVVLCIRSDFLRVSVCRFTNVVTVLASSRYLC